MGEKAERIQDELERACRERGASVTAQRRVVFEALRGRSDHPTADQVFEAARARLPEISRRTVYRVLDALVEWGVIRRVAHPGASARFDPITARHHHLVCLRCGKTVDHAGAVAGRVALPEGRPSGFDVVDFSVQFLGVCAECRAAGVEGRAAVSPTQGEE